MKRWIAGSVLAALMAATPSLGQEALFADDFQGKLGPGWSWVREDAKSWRLTEKALEIRIDPGNLWGRSNNAKNVLVRPAPDLAAGAIEAAVTVTTQTTEQFEQAGIAWYYNDSYMVKLIREQVDGKMWVVMGREEADATRTLGKVPLETATVRLRLLVSGNSIRGQFQPAGSDQWQDAGQSTLPAPPDGQAKLSLHCYNGPPAAEHWARFERFRVARTSEK